MKIWSALLVTTWMAATTVWAAPGTWTGQISDSMCKAKHTSMGGKKMTDRECTEMCVKANAKYVFASEGKVYQLANQQDAALATHAGHTVVLTGEVKNDTITVSNIQMPKAAKP